MIKLALVLLFLGTSLAAQSLAGRPPNDGAGGNPNERKALDRALLEYCCAIKLAKKANSGFTKAETDRMEKAKKNFKDADKKGRIRVDDKGKRPKTTPEKTWPGCGCRMSSPDAGRGQEVTLFPASILPPTAPPQGGVDSKDAKNGVIVGHEGERLGATQAVPKNGKPSTMKNWEKKAWKKAMNNTLRIVCLSLKVNALLMEKFAAFPPIVTNLKAHKRALDKEKKAAKSILAALGC